MSESIYDQLQGPRDPWEYAEMGQITPYQARMREKAGQAAAEHKIEVVTNGDSPISSAETRGRSEASTSRSRRSGVPVSQLSAPEKRIRDDHREDDLAPYGTADPIILNQPGAIGPSSEEQVADEQTQAQIKEAFERLRSLTHPSKEVTGESAKVFFEALHGDSPR